MVRNGIFWTIGKQSYIVYYPIISYRMIKVYRVESMDMGRSQWNNNVIGTFSHIHKYGSTYCKRYVTLVGFLLQITFVCGIIR